MYRFLQSIQRLSLLTTTTTTTTTATATTTFRSFSNYTRRHHLPGLRIPLYNQFAQAGSRLPDSALVGERLILHNKVQSLIRSGYLESALALTTTAIDAAAVSSSNKRPPTVFTCNVVMASMYKDSRYDDVLRLFEYFFQTSKIIPNIVSYNILIKAHCAVGRVDAALDVYRHRILVPETPFGPSPVTYAHLTKGLIDSNRISEAVDLLREIPDYIKVEGNQDNLDCSLVYNNLIYGFLLLGKLDKALELLIELQEKCHVYYDGVVHATFMDWYFKNGLEKEAMECYQTLLNRQFAMKPATGNALLDVFHRYGKILEASVLFDNMLNSHNPPEHYAVNSDTYNIMVNGYLKLDKISEAMDVFRKTGTKQGSKPYVKDASCFSNVVGKLCERGLVSDAIQLFNEVKQGSTPYEMDAASYSCIVARLCERGLVSDAEKLLEELRMSPSTLDFTTFKSFIEVYLKEDRVDDAIQLFKELLFIYDLMPAKGFCEKVFDELIKKGRLQEALDVLGKMGRREVKPDPTSYEIVIMGLSNAGRLDCVQDLLNQMEKNRIAVTPTLQCQNLRKS